MFEQSLYETEPVAAPLKEGDLFHNYEVKNWDLGPRIYKILAIAGAANLLALLITAQTSLLTMKGCDSPFVGSVCQVLDTVVVGAKIFGTEREYIDAAYEKTDLGDADVTFIDVTDAAPPLSYPEGYFQLANPEQFVAQVEQPADTGITNGSYSNIPSYTPPSTVGRSMTDIKPKYPKANDVLDGQELPDGFDSDSTASNGKPGKKKPTPTPTPDQTTAGNQKTDPTAPITSVDVNKRPFVDLAAMVNELLDKKQVKLDTPFYVSAVGKLKGGRFENFKFVKRESADPKMLDVIKRAIEALNESNLLGYLSQLEGQQLMLEVTQDGDRVIANIQTDFKDDVRARSMAGIIKFGLDLKKKEKENPNADQNDKDDLVLLNNATVSTDGKKLIIKFDTSQIEVQQMLQRKLAEQKAQPNPANPGMTVSNSANNTAVK